MKLIHKMVGSVPNTGKLFEINLAGKNLLLVGGNGSGKTSFLTAVFSALQRHIVQEQILHLGTYEQSLKDHLNALAGYSQNNDDDDNKSRLLTGLRNTEKAIADIISPVDITYNNAKEFIKLRGEKLGTIKFFPAARQAQIANVTAATGSRVDIKVLDINANLGTKLEQHLVNLRVRAALSSQMEGDEERLTEINEWFSKFQINLQYLFEDDELSLKFDADKLRFVIAQHGRGEYTFQTLSSGYLAIFDIYADLLMHLEYLNITPEELAGVVLIDEIDAHLHVSLQRKIFPFLSQSFPNVQFIVTTHSPFVVTSVDDALIYDISNGRECGDLSMYSVDAVVEGLLGVPPISKSLVDMITNLTKLTSAADFNVIEIERILNKISPYAESLDNESRMFYEIAINKMIKKKQGGN